MNIKRLKRNLRKGIDELLNSDLVTAKQTTSLYSSTSMSRDRIIYLEVGRKSPIEISKFLIKKKTNNDFNFRDI